MKTKQQIYARMLHHGLAGIRNRSGRYNNRDAAYCLAVSDLLHNLPQYMLDERWLDNDMHFFTMEVRSYIDYCHYLQIPADPTLLELVAELRDIMPEGWKSEFPFDKAPGINAEG